MGEVSWRCWLVIACLAGLICYDAQAFAEAIDNSSQHASSEAAPNDAWVKAVWQHTAQTLTHDRNFLVQHAARFAAINAAQQQAALGYYNHIIGYFTHISSASSQIGVKEYNAARSIRLGNPTDFHLGLTAYKGIHTAVNSVANHIHELLDLTVDVQQQTQLSGCLQRYAAYLEDAVLLEHAGYAFADSTPTAATHTEDSPSQHAAANEAQRAATAAAQHAQAGTDARQPQTLSAERTDGEVPAASQTGHHAAAAQPETLVSGMHAVSSHTSDVMHDVSSHADDVMVDDVMVDDVIAHAHDDWLAVDSTAAGSAQHDDEYDDEYANDDEDDDSALESFEQEPHETIVALQQYGKQLYLDADARNVTAAIAGLQELAALLDSTAFSSPKSRRRMVAHDAADQHWALQHVDSHAVAGGGHQIEQTPRLIAASDAAFMLSALSSSGIVASKVPKNESWAARLQHKGAMLQSVEAHLALADRYSRGRGAPQSCTTAFHHLQMAAQYYVTVVEQESNYGFPIESVRLRDRWRDAGYVAHAEIENGLQRIMYEQDAAMRGNLEAQNQMGYRRLIGRGMATDAEGAFLEFQQAAARGDAYGTYNLGYMYMNGLHVARNYTKARALYEHAARHGLPSAHNGIGVLHFNGWGVPVNHTAAFAAFQLGAAMQDADSVFNLASMYSGGWGVAANATRAAELLEDALVLGHWRAPLQLAGVLHDGVGVPRDCARAEQLMWVFINERSVWTDLLEAAVQSMDDGDHWAALLQYIFLAEQGSDAAAMNAAWMLEHGVGYNASDRHQLAYDMYMRAARYNNTEAMVDAANLLYSGDKLQLSGGGNHTAAAQLYGAAADLGDVEGMTNLAWMHEWGMGVPANTSLAESMYIRAFHAAHSEAYALPPLLLLCTLRLRCSMSAMVDENLLAAAAAALHDMLSVLQQLQPSMPAMAAVWQPITVLQDLVNALLSGLDFDNFVISLLFCCLAAVLWLRQQRHAQRHTSQRAARQQPQHMAATAVHSTAAADGTASTPPQSMAALSDAANASDQDGIRLHTANASSDAAAAVDTPVAAASCIGHNSAAVDTNLPTAARSSSAANVAEGAAHDITHRDAHGSTAVQNTTVSGSHAAVRDVPDSSANAVDAPTCTAANGILPSALRTIEDRAAGMHAGSAGYVNNVGVSDESTSGACKSSLVNGEVQHAVNGEHILHHGSKDQQGNQP